MSDAPGPGAPPTARELLLRSALGALLALLPAVAYVLTMPNAHREGHYFLAIGLFLGGLAGLAGLAERLGAGRRVWVQVGVALAFAALTTGWGLVAVLQAEWTRTALTAGPDAAGAAVVRFLGEALEAWDEVLQLFVPLGATLAGQTLVRTRRGGWFAQLAAVALPLVLGSLIIGPKRVSEFVLFFGGALAVMNAASAWAAHALAKKWCWTEGSAGET